MPRRWSSPLPTFSLRTLLTATTLLALVGGNLVSLWRLDQTRAELESLRREVGYLRPSEKDQVVAVAIPAEQPLTYRFRVRVPTAGRGSPSAAATHRVVYSTVIPRGKMSPVWYGGVAVPPGESVVTLTIAEDPRDERWKISTLVRGEHTTQRISSVLTDEHTKTFRRSHNVINAGIGRESIAVSDTQPLRLLDQRWLVGEHALLLYGNRGTPEDQVGVYAELQPADEPLASHPFVE